ncbi:mitochondrial import receptor subunit TOM22 homolog [Orussus abietinus]|uniref:mitochondrial import receptor subunit TOM22 homolog n=1 Tax=Orussus abietinus TaxID=222816 RepID=UPI00062679C9|nr:mitochondrial import receptor subunit TOM22 homolog [Orussus abietinus]
MASVEELDQLDSGMGSSDMRSPEIKFLFDDDDENLNEEDESLTERLIGLTEMFPKEVRNFGYSFGSCLSTCIKGLYAYSCSATWLIVSSSVILFAPVLFEIERAQMEEMQRSQQKQVLLGPSSAVSNLSSPSLPIAPPVQR